MDNEVVINGETYVKKCEISDNYVIVRCFYSGVWAGEVISENGTEITLRNARKIWYWDGGEFTCAEIANHGFSSPEKCKLTEIVNEVRIKDAKELIPTTKKAAKSISEVVSWNPKK